MIKTPFNPKTRLPRVLKFAGCVNFSNTPRENGPMFTPQVLCWWGFTGDTLQCNFRKTRPAKCKHAPPYIWGGLHLLHVLPSAPIPQMSPNGFGTNLTLPEPVGNFTAPPLPPAKGQPCPVFQNTARKPITPPPVPTAARNRL